MATLLQLLQSGTEQPVSQAVSTSPDLIVTILIGWAVVAGLGMFLAFARAGVR